MKIPNVRIFKMEKKVASRAGTLAKFGTFHTKNMLLL
jgi:hypothetical protein